VDKPCEVAQPRLDLVPVQPVEPPLEPEELDAALRRVERRLLERDADPEPHVERLSSHVEPADLGATRRRQQQRAAHVHQPRPPGAVWSQEAVDLPRLDLEVDTVDGAGLVEEAPKTLGPYGGIGHGGPTY